MTGSSLILTRTSLVYRGLAGAEESGPRRNLSDDEERSRHQRT